MEKQVRQGLIFFDEIQPKVETKTIVKVTPTKRTGFSLSKDSDGTYDIHIRFNPTRFFVETTEAIVAFKGFKVAVGGLFK